MLSRFEENWFDHEKTIAGRLLLVRKCCYFGHNICVAWIVAFASHKMKGRKLAMVLLFSVVSNLGWKVVLKGRLPITISQFFLRSVRVKLKVTLHSCILNYCIQISFGKKPGYFTAIKHYRCWRKKASGWEKIWICRDVIIALNPLPSPIIICR